MRRALGIAEHAIGAIGRRRGRSAALLVGLAVTTGLFASATMLTDALRAAYTGALDASPSLVVQPMLGGRPALAQTRRLAPIEQHPGVRAVRPRVWGYVFVDALEANVTVVATSAVRDVMRAPTVLDGRLPERPGEMALGATLARTLGLRVGDEMALPTTNEGFHLLRVVGRFTGETAIRTADVVLTTETDARVLLGMAEGWCADFAVWLANEDEAGVVAAHVAALPGARMRVIDRERQRRAYGLTFDTRSGLLAVAFLPTLAALLLLAWERLMGLGADERREIAILKAVGWETRDVLASRLWESTLLALGGTLLGVALAYAYVFPLGAPGLRHALFGWSLLYPPIDLVPSTDPVEIAAFVAIVVVPFVAVSILPAWRAATVDLEDVVRGAA